MFRFGGGLPKYSVSITLQQPPASEDLVFHWLENEDHENVAVRLHSQLKKVVATLSRASPNGPPARCKLQMNPAGGTPDTDVIIQILATLLPYGPDEVVFCDQYVRLCDASAALPVLRSLPSVSLTACNLSSLPEGLANLDRLLSLNVSGNKLAVLPSDIGKLTALETLDASNNAITALPESIKQLTNLRHLSLAGNRIVAPVLDPRTLNRLTALELHGNPLRYLPEVSYYSELRLLSLANMQVSADDAFTEWTVTVFERASYASIGALRQNPHQPLINLLFRRSSCQHPLLAGLLAKLAEEAPAREAMRQQNGALQQLVLMLLSDREVVVAKACEVLTKMAADGDTASALERAAVIRAVHTLCLAESTKMQLNGLKLLEALAVSSDAVAVKVMTRDTLGVLAEIISHPSASDEVRTAALLALSSLAFPEQNKATLLGFPGFLQLLNNVANAKTRFSDPVRSAAVRNLAVLGQLGHVDAAVGRRPIRGRGVRILALDGGGMRGLAMVKMLSVLEKRTGQRVHQLFDVIGGTSTGAMVAMGLGVMKLTVEEMQRVYTDMGKRVFSEAAADGERQASWSDLLTRMYKSGEQSVRVAVYGAKHSSAVFEQLLQEGTALQRFGCTSDVCIDASWVGGPRVFCVATLSSVLPAAPFVFRTYEFPPHPDPAARAATLRLHDGSSKYHLWEAIRASSAAPYYLEDFTLGQHRFQDGAATVNNPSVVAIQEARALFPDRPIECLVSLGCGALPPATRPRGMSSYIDTGNMLIESACSVQRSDEALSALLPLCGAQYFRFNPVDARCYMELDGIDAGPTADLLAATTEYVDREAERFDAAAAALQVPPEPEDEGAQPTPTVSTARFATRPGVLLLSSALSAAGPPLTHVDAVVAAVRALRLVTADLDIALCEPPPKPQLLPSPSRLASSPVDLPKADASGRALAIDVPLLNDLASARVYGGADVAPPGEAAVSPAPADAVRDQSGSSNEVSASPRESSFGEEDVDTAATGVVSAEAAKPAPPSVRTGVRGGEAPAALAAAAGAAAAATVPASPSIIGSFMSIFGGTAPAPPAPAPGRESADVSGLVASEFVGPPRTDASDPAAAPRPDAAADDAAPPTDAADSAPPSVLAYHPSDASTASRDLQSHALPVSEAEVRHWSSTMRPHAAPPAPVGTTQRGGGDPPDVPEAASPGRTRRVVLPSPASTPLASPTRSGDGAGAGGPEGGADEASLGPWPSPTALSSCGASPAGQPTPRRSGSGSVFDGGREPQLTWSNVEQRATEKLKEMSRMRTGGSVASLPYLAEDDSRAADSDAATPSASGPANQLAESPLAAPGSAASVSFDSSPRRSVAAAAAGRHSARHDSFASQASPAPSSPSAVPSQRPAAAAVNPLLAADAAACPLLAALSDLPDADMARCGIVVLGAYATGRGVVMRHASAVRALAEPSADAAALLAEIEAAAPISRDDGAAAEGRREGRAPAPPAAEGRSLEATFTRQRLVMAGDASGRFWRAPVCSSMTLRTLGEGEAVAASVCSMLVHAYAPEEWVGEAGLRALAHACSSRLVLSACELPRHVVDALLEGGALGVVGVKRRAWRVEPEAVARCVVAFLRKLQSGGLVRDAVQSAPGGLELLHVDDPVR